MPLLRTYFLLAILTLSLGLQAQTDSSATEENEAPRLLSEEASTIEDDSIVFRPTERNPKRAALMSALVPGLGQIYNKKYWKLPLVYGGLGTAGFFIGYNRVWWQRYKNAYVTDTNVTDGTTSIYYAQGVSLDQLRAAADQHRTWMEYSYLAFAAVYALQIIDATVDAHLFYFDVSDDLTMRIQPTLQYTRKRDPIHGLALNFTF